MESTSELESLIRSAQALLNVETLTPEGPILSGGSRHFRSSTPSRFSKGQSSGRGVRPTYTKRRTWVTGASGEEDPSQFAEEDDYEGFQDDEEEQGSDLSEDDEDTDEESLQEDFEAFLAFRDARRAQQHHR